MTYPQNPLPLTIILTIVLTTSAGAQEERESRYPAGWNAIRDLIPAQIETIRSQGNRIVQIDRMGTFPHPTYNVTFVRNRDHYHRSGATWWEGTVSSIQQKLGTTRRLLDIEPSGWVNPTTPKFLAVMIDNTGAQKRTWAWYYGTAAYIASKTNGRRIIDLDGFKDPNGRQLYSAVMIANTGADARSWWWYSKTSHANIVAQAKNLGAQILDFERLDYGSNDDHCAVLVKHPTRPTPAHTWYRWKYWNDVKNLLTASPGARIVKLDSLGVMPNGQNIYDVLMLDNRGHSATYGKGCSGSGRGSKVPGHTATGQVKPKGTVQLRLSLAAPRSLVLLILGTSNRFWGRQILPQKLDFLGAPGCELLTAPEVLVPMVSDSVGGADVTAQVPDADLIGLTFYTQFACADRTANAFGTTFSNGVELRVGQ